MRQALLTKKVQQLRRRIVQSLHGGVFAVQNAQRVAVQAAFSVLIKLLGVLLKISDQGSAVL